MTKFVSSSKLMFRALLFSIGLTRVGGVIEVLVPAYANPCCVDGPGMWNGLISSAVTANTQISIILNPASGPGGSVGDPIDPNYVSANGLSGPLLDFVSAGGKAYGYVATGFGTNDINLVKEQVDRYYDVAYYGGGNGILVHGIFFDEWSNKLADVGYNQGLRDHVKLKDASAKVIGNPGVSFTDPVPPSAYTVTEYVEAADTIITFENYGSVYRTSYAAPSWIDDYPQDNFGHLVHTEASLANMEEDVSLAYERKAGMLYITDDNFVSNPWDKLATYWSELLAAIDEGQDSDGDGVPDKDDLCPNTVIPEATIPTKRLIRNRWALVDDDTTFDTHAGASGHSFTVEETGGCSGEQIIEKMGLGNGHKKFGVSTGAMKEWIAQVGN